MLELTVKGKSLFGAIIIYQFDIFTLSQLSLLFATDNYGCHKQPVDFYVCLKLIQFSPFPISEIQTKT